MTSPLKYLQLGMPPKTDAMGGKKIPFQQDLLGYSTESGAPSAMNLNPDAHYGANAQRMLESHYDNRIAGQRQQEDLNMQNNPAVPFSGFGAKLESQIMAPMNRGRQDAAMGPQGYNRNWAASEELPYLYGEEWPSKRFGTNYNSFIGDAQQREDVNQSNALQGLIEAVEQNRANEMNRR